MFVLVGMTNNDKVMDFCDVKGCHCWPDVEYKDKEKRLHEICGHHMQEIRDSHGRTKLEYERHGLIDGVEQVYRDYCLNDDKARAEWHHIE